MTTPTPPPTAPFTQEQLDYLDATYPHRTQVPSLDENFATATVGPYHDVFLGGIAQYFFVAPFKLRITHGAFFMYGSMTASDTNYCSLSLGVRRVADSSYQTIVNGDVKLSGPNSWGMDLPYGRAYSWDAFAYDESAALLQPYDTVAFAFNVTGNPTIPRGQCAVTVGYVPE